VNISWWISHWANWTPEKTALRFEGRSIEYAELERRVGELAAFLSTSGVRPGDRVAYLGPNTPELLETLFASARVGAIFVPLNPRMPPAELRVFVEQSEPRLLVVEESFRADAVASAPELDSDLLVFGRDGLAPHMGAAAPLAADPELDGATPVLIAYTSGTSGVPKGAVLTHEALTANALNAIAAFGITADDEILTAAPMFHVGGLNIHTTPALRAGATVTVHRRFDPALALAEIERVSATLFVAVPTMSLAMTAHPAWPVTEIASLRCVATGSTLVPDAAVRPWLDRGVPVSQVYGLTETCPSTTIVPPQESHRKAASAGKAVMHCRVAVVDASGRELPPLEVGEVVIRGSNVMQGYWRNAEATREAFRGGWFRSGDAGFLDEEGYLHIVERMKDVIVVGGSNVYPADVEQILVEFRAPDQSLSGAELVARFESRLAAYKHPRDVVFLDELPRTALGKVRKDVLRAVVAGADSARARRARGAPPRARAGG
jgi:acyl-CoA synthetase (AMP-forming)/AMP-acid ligase II